MEWLPVVSRLRGLRAFRDPDLRLVTALRPITARLHKQADRRDDLVDRWAAVVPERLRAGVQLGRLVRGELTVHCPSASARALIDRWLRAGGAVELSKAGISRVKTTIHRKRLA